MSMPPSGFRCDNSATSPWDCSPARSKRPAFRPSPSPRPWISPPLSSRLERSSSIFPSATRSGSRLTLTASEGSSSTPSTSWRRPQALGRLWSSSISGTNATRSTPGKRRRSSTPRRCDLPLSLVAVNAPSELRSLFADGIQFDLEGWGGRINAGNVL